MAPPTILLVPGSFSLPSFYDNLVESLAALKIPIKVLPLQSAGTSAGAGRDGVPPPTMLDDAAFIAAEIRALADAGTDVVLVAHSYGGVPASESTKGLTRGERLREGKEGGVVRIGYLTALVPEVEVSAGEMLVGVPEEQKLDIQVHVSILFIYSVCRKRC